MAKNSNLHKAKKAKIDEFFTLYSDIEKELKYYEDFLKGKTIYCNCDNPQKSNFYKYFVDNFERLGLKKVIATGYNPNGRGWFAEYTGNETFRELEGNGDFRSEECKKYLDECDVVITNPPFSLFREYMKLIYEKGKKFLVIGPLNVVFYKDITPHIIKKEFLTGLSKRGHSQDMWFVTPDGNMEHFGFIYWYSNAHNVFPEPLDLKCTYDPELYPKYDDIDAIEVPRCAKIPKDYYGVMGVPIGFVDKWNPEQFELMSSARPHLKGKETYSRLLIKRKN